VKLREVYRYELAYRLRSPSTWLYAGFLLLAAMWTYLATAEGDIHVNAPVRIAGGSVIAGMLGLLVSAAIFGDAAVRDYAAEMEALLFTSSVRTGEYLGGRFLAALTVNALLLIAIPLGQLAATLLATSMQTTTVGPFRLLAYLQPWPLFILPNLILAGAILYAIGLLSRHVVPVYLGAIALFITYIVGANAAEQVTNPALTLLTDPIGLHALQAMTRYWTPSEQDTRLIGFSAELLVNRAVWLTFAAAVFLLLYRSFRFAHAGGASRRARMARVVSEVAPTRRTRVVELPRVTGTFDPRMSARQALAVARRSLGEAFASRWFIGVLVACTVLTVVFGWNVAQTVFDTSTWPVTMLVAGTVLAQRVTPVIYVLIALYAGELVWKSRDANENEIVDAAPVPDGIALAGRFIALVAMIVMFQLATLVGGLLIQSRQGYYHFEIGLYLEVLFGLKLVDYVLFAVAAMAIQVLVNHKYLGHMVLVLAFLALLTLRMLGFVTHHLLLYGTDPGWTYSDINGFGPFLRPWLWFKLYWAAWALLLLVVTALFWVRGREPGMRHRVARARAGFGGAMARSAAVAIALIVALGGFVFYNTNVLNEYHSVRDAGAAQANYEKRYKRFLDAPQPMITDATLQIEIHSGEPAVELRCTYRLVNRTTAAIDSVHVMLLDPSIAVSSMSFDRAAKPVVLDDDANYRIYALDRALAPGDSLQLVFDVAFRPHGFPNSDTQTKVYDNGASFDRSWLPAIGYQPVKELAGIDARKRFGLAPQPRTPGADDAQARQIRWPVRNEDLVHLDAVVGTAADQTVIMPGTLRRSWLENGRRYFHYETRPTLFGANVISGRYAVVEDRWTPAGSADSATGRANHAVALKIFHYPGHHDNLDRTLHGMKAALDYYTTHFSPYAYDELTVVELPRYGGFGRALAHTVTFTEDYFLSRVKEGEVDQPFYGTAHEVAHQWWGGQVQGAPVRGHDLLTESLANYSAMLVTAETYGPATGRRLYDAQMERYLRGRAEQSHEVPLLDVDGQPYLAYRKGAIALYTLRGFIGEAAVDTALRTYLRKYRDAGPPFPTSRDLYAELRAVSPDSLHPLLSDLFETITLWDVKADSAVVAKTKDGRYQVTLDVVAKKGRADGVGRLTEVPMDDLVEIGVLAAGTDGAPGEPLYLQRQRIHSGRQRISITVSRLPARAGVDPYHKLIDRNGGDNEVPVKANGAPTQPGRS